MPFTPGDEDTLDLHGLRVKEALELFLRTYNSRIQDQPFGSLVVVHGYGSSGEGGKIRRRLRSFLDQYPLYLTYQRGEELGNPGITIVFPHQLLPTSETLLEEEVFAFCTKPRTREKIAGKFRKYGQPQVLETIRKLERQGLLEVISCGSHRCYRQAVQTAG
ncbi:MAG: Smr/MutS family protein [Anaerolineales bacterium]|nr:Smr/MutS family protein [Anaerolineales bacterium]